VLGENNVPEIIPTKGVLESPLELKSKGVKTPEGGFSPLIDPK
jgi:hypothetical protein